MDSNPWTAAAIPVHVGGGGRERNASSSAQIRLPANSAAHARLMSRLPVVGGNVADVMPTTWISWGVGEGIIFSSDRVPRTENATMQTRTQPQITILRMIHLRSGWVRNGFTRTDR